MDNDEEGSSNVRKFLNKTKSCAHPSSALKLRNEPAKRKAFNLNEAVRSLDLALGRLKKSKTANSDFNSAVLPPSERRGASAEIFMDMSSPSSNINPGIDNASLMSMNFSHYELMRNLSQANSQSDGAFSGTNCSVYSNGIDRTLKDERLERYFRSVEIWSQKCGGPNVHYEVPEK